LFSTQQILESARKTIQLEASSVASLANQINGDFCEVVNAIHSLKGRVVLSGIGKSAIIAQKISATLNSTGTPSTFMHAAEAVHGDLGTITKDDLVICISKSGNTPEIKALIPLLRQGDNPLVAIVGNLDSYLATQADYILDTTVEREACPNNLAPTSSTTAQLVMGDALAVCLLEMRAFGSEDFARFHPGGALGKRLYLKLGDLMVHNEKPEVSPDTLVQDAIFEISRKRLGMSAVTENGRLVGVITDGDIRRALEKGLDMNNAKAGEVMSQSPVHLPSDTLAVEAAALMREKKISQLIVIDNEHYLGVVHIHDLNREGIL
jgi:arabinose-5-phosphate isomerase